MSTQQKPTSVVSGTRPQPAEPPRTIAQAIYPYLPSSNKPTERKP
jgi:hypothetical protein